MSRNRNNRFNLLLTEGLLLLYNRGARMILGMPRGFYESYARELSEVFTYSMSAR